VTTQADYAAIVGAANILSPADGLDRYQADGRAAAGKAGCVVRPASPDQVSAVMRLAAARGDRIVVQGANTGLVGAGLPDDSGRQIVLSLDRLDDRIEIDPDNRSATVAAGVRLSALNAAAAEHGLTFPIDLGADPSIGGMIAANTGGARFLRYGDVRRNLMAVEAVLADDQGRIVRFGSALWKDNSGLDLKQLLVGGSGSLGVITAASVALQPLAPNRLTAMAALDDTGHALATLRLLEQSFGGLLTAFEGISGEALSLALRHVPRLRNPFATVPAYALLIELSGGDAVPVDWLEEQLAEVLGQAMETGAVADIVVDRRDGLWAIRHAVPEGLRAAGQVIACDIALRRGDVFAFRQEMRQALAARWPELMLCDFGHVGDGGLHFNMVWPRALGPAPADPRDIVFDAVLARGGSFSAEHGVGPRNAAYYDAHVPAPVRRIAGQVQRVLAPRPIGRVDFGEGEAVRV
jgi:FAD/FMN-containing dehydrogenase